MGPRAGLDGCGKYRPPPGFDPRTVQPVAIPGPVDTVVNLTVSRGILLEYLIGYQLLMWILFRTIDYQTFRLAEYFLIDS